jgi:hypothetical protein
MNTAYLFAHTTAKRAQDWPEEFLAASLSQGETRYYQNPALDFRKTHCH